MRCAVAFSVLLAGCGVLLGDSPDPGRPSQAQGAGLLDDLVRMTRGGSSDATVLAYARAHRLELPAELSDATLRWLADSGVGERVVRYMAAIDVRASAETAPDLTYGSQGEDEDDAARSPDRYSSEESSRRYELHSRDDYPDRDAGDSRYTDLDSGAYGDSFSDSYAFDSYPWDSFSSFGSPYPVYPSYFFVDRFDSFRRFPRRDRRDDRFGGGRHRRGGVDHGRGHDAWRERGFRGGRGGPMLAGPRGSGRSGFARGGSRAAVPGLRGRAIGPRGFGSAGAGRRDPAPVFRGPRGGAGHGGFRSPGFSRHPGLRAGGASGRGTNPGIGRGRAPAGSPGARGRR